MPMVIHKNFTDDDVHTDIARDYPDVTARNNDPAFHNAAVNINKNVRVDSPASVFKLLDTAPTWLELGGATGLGNVTTSDVLDLNFLLRGNGGVDINQIGDGVAGMFSNTLGNELTIRPPAGTLLAKIKLQDDGGLEIFEIASDTSGGQNEIKLKTPIAGDHLHIETADLKFILTGLLDLNLVDTFAFDINRTGGDDTNPLFGMGHSGTNPGGFNSYAGNRTPIGLVSADPGDLYYREDGIDSRVYQHRGATPGTSGWIELGGAVVVSKITFAVDSNTGALGVFSIYECTDTTLFRTLTISTATIALGTPSLPHRFTVKDGSLNAENTGIVIVPETGLIDGALSRAINRNGGSLELYVDGTNVFIESASRPLLAGPNYTGFSFDVSVQASVPASMLFDPTGLIMYILDNVTNDGFVYNLTEPWTMKGGNVVYSGTSFAFNAGTGETSPTTFFWGDSGNKLYMGGISNSTIYEYNASTPYDLSTISLSGSTLVVSGEENTLTAMELSSDGTKLWITGTQNGVMRQYTLSTPWDLSTAGAVDVASLSFIAQDTNPESFQLTADGLTIIMSGVQNGRLYQYNMTVANDITTAVYSGISYSTALEDAVPTSAFCNFSGTKLFVCGVTTPDKVYEYLLNPVGKLGL